MFDTRLRPYEMINVIDNNCSLCEGLSQIYNLKTNGYDFAIPEEIGQGCCRQIVANHDFQVLYFDMNFSRRIEVQGISRTPHIDLFFCFEEGFQWEFQEHQTQMKIVAGEIFFAKSQDDNKRCIYPAKGKMRFVQIKMSLQKFEEVIKNMYKEWDILGLGEGEEIFRRSSFSPAIHVILQQMLNCPYKNALKNMYMEGKLLELFAVYLDEILHLRNKVDPAIKLTTVDIKGIYKAREILDNSIMIPPSLVSLAKQVCLNQFKLKYGFKRIFGETVHAYVITRRLDLARQFFEERQMSVSEAAGIIGYANLSHFAQAFRRRFGVNPGEYLRKVIK